MDYDGFGTFIKQKRIEKNYTQKDLAERLNVTDKAVSKWERGLCYPDLSLYELLSTTLDVPLNALMAYRGLGLNDGASDALFDASSKKTKIGMLILVYIVCGIAVYVYATLHPEYLFLVKRVYRLILFLAYFCGLILFVLKIGRNNQ